jgi:ribosome-binding factor A
MKNKEQYAEHIAHKAADFLSRESNRTSLITVTRADVTEKMSVVHVYCSVFPESDEANAYIFLQRKAGEFRQYLMHEQKMVRVPHVNFVIDLGEKNRVRLEEISKITPKEGEVSPLIEKRETPKKKTAKK